MAYIYKGLNGRKITEVIARNEGVQADLERRTFEIAARADAELVRHRQDGHAEIDIESGDIDFYVILSDERGQMAALSIEYGRAGYIDPQTGEEYGEMEGLFILHHASRLPKDSRPKIKVPRLRRKRGRR
ncbi:DUF5403 family protein [Actinoplanes sp. NPDC049118]|uniref:DUF5403 family protein n=1 Tax=Actinoplanes sp. NPDC049118 TaxID=3155769 RepID=UPI00340BE43F